MPAGAYSPVTVHTRENIYRIVRHQVVQSTSARSPRINPPGKWGATPIS
jgi:hypothetical protein